MIDYTGLDREISRTFIDQTNHGRAYSEKIAMAPIGKGFIILFRCLDDQESGWGMYGVGDLRLTFDSFEKAEAMWYRTLLRRLGSNRISDLKWDYKVNGNDGLF